MPIDPEVQSMLDVLDAGFPRVETMTGAEARAVVRSRYQPNPDPEPVASVQDREIDGPHGPIPVRIYRPAESGSTPLPVVVFAHGGGFVFCDLDTHDGLCRAMANGVGAVVVSVDYRLAPEHPAPTAFDDVYAALEWAAVHCADLDGDPQRLVVAGDSAGGNLAATVALAARDRRGPDVAAQVLLYPVIDDDFETDSYRTYSTGHFNTRAAMQWYWQQYAPGGADSTLVSPQRADTLSGVAPAVVVTASRDPLSSEGDAYATRLAADGVPTVHRVYDGLFHGFLTIPVLSITQIARKQLWEDLRSVLASPN
ncbi:alpha/beta hydrolase [Prescottella subtropica]|uniref:alpha/beta hydrolase n=1 Tax=Prescottella subtropica TaxID=2545757 RepID=UPI0010F6B97C|nr:alpha/beta hydrolase [Prescottella subtropica]